MEFEKKPYKEAILYLRDIINGKVRPEKIESAQARINQLLDQSVIATDDARKYIINEEGKVIDPKVIDGLSWNADRQAKILVRSMKWIPAYKDGKPVPAKRMLVVHFPNTGIDRIHF